MNKVLKVMILGDTGRAYAMAKRLKEQRNKNIDVLLIPGSSAATKYASVLNLNPSDYAYVTNVMKVYEREQPSLVLVMAGDVSQTGIVERLREADACVFGVGKVGIKFEEDRSWANRLCRTAGIRTPEDKEFEAGSESIPSAVKFVDSHNKGWVIKLGDLLEHNVHVCDTKEETLSVLMWLARSGYKGGIVLEEKMEGTEVSFTVAVTKYQGIVPVATVFEHKRLVTGDMGCMTGEMGSLVVSGVARKGMQLFEKLHPHLAKTGYTGLLDINCILGRDGELGFIEFTCRWGDPTCEILLPMVANDWAQLCMEWANGVMSRPRFRDKYGVGVVLASSGYPYKDACMQGIPIRVKTDESGYAVMSAHYDEGTDTLYTKGGRQVIALGYGEEVETAREKAYSNAKGIQFIDRIFRLDIAGSINLDYCRYHGVLE